MALPNIAMSASLITEAPLPRQQISRIRRLLINCFIDRAVKGVALGLKSFTAEEPSYPKFRWDRVAAECTTILDYAPKIGIVKRFTF